MDFIINNLPSVSSSGVVSDSVFERHVDPTRPGYYWFVKSGVQNQANYIFWGSPNTTKSEGMGGRIIPFKCTDGQVIDIQGPWWSNVDAFFESTGIDIRDKFYTFVVISRRRSYNGLHYTMEDVVYKDDEHVLGDYDRWKQVLRDVFSVIDDEKLFVYHASFGGSCHSYEHRKDHT